MRQWFRSFFRKSTRESQRVQEIRKRKESDFQRWSRSDVMHDNWQERTVALSKYIKKGSSVVEFGAGAAILQSALDVTIQYQPVDIIKRKENFIVCDLNSYPLDLDLTRYDTALFSGVLEYVYDLDTLLLELSKNIKYIPLSYACRDVCKQNRLNNGWLSDYSSDELEAIFEKYSYKIVHKSLWKDQSIYFLQYE